MRKVRRSAHIWFILKILNQCGDLYVNSRPRIYQLHTYHWYTRIRLVPICLYIISLLLIAQISNNTIVVVVVVVVVVVAQKGRAVLLWSIMTRRSIVSPRYFKMVLRYYSKHGVDHQAYLAILRHVLYILVLQEHTTQGSESFVCQCQAMTQSRQSIFFSSPHSRQAILLLCETEFNHMGSEGCVALLTVPQPFSASAYSLRQALFLHLTEVQSYECWTGGNRYRSPPVPVLLSL